MTLASHVYAAPLNPDKITFQISDTVLTHAIRSGGAIAVNVTNWTGIQKPHDVGTDFGSILAVRSTASDMEAPSNSA